LIGLLASQAARAQETQDQGAKPWLGLIAGPAAASETQLAADMASLFPQDASLRVLPMLGDGGAGNLALLLDDAKIDMAFVSTDVLAEAASKEKSLADRLELVARLAPQEVHLLARHEIASLSDLSGKEVNVGPAGSASAIAAAAVLKAHGLNVVTSSLDDAAAIEQLKQGAISAVVIVGAKPSPLISAIPITAGVHLLSIPFGAPLEVAYLPARLGSGDYPNLIRSGGEVSTLATGMVLLAAKANREPESQARIDRFVAALFPRFAELQRRHPKWRDVNLAASLPGFKRNAAAEAWLAAHAEEKVKPIAASASVQSPALPELMSKEQQEALFRRFIEWKRAKER
jgi:TRAP transporter TAXI family solute receptor